MVGVPSKYGLQTWRSFKAKAEGKNGWIWHFKQGLY
jgi:hypothetical protein